eukprot:5906302-Amphidinium_carterae.1
MLPTAATGTVAVLASKQDKKSCSKVTRSKPSAQAAPPLVARFPKQCDSNRLTGTAACNSTE